VRVWNAAVMTLGYLWLAEVAGCVLFGVACAFMDHRRTPENAEVAALEALYARSGGGR